MSEESLRSLKYCLGWLRWANEHIGKVILALKQVLEQYDHEGRSNSSSTIEGSCPNEKEGQLVVRSDAERAALNTKIAALKGDVRHMAVVTVALLIVSGLVGAYQTALQHGFVPLPPCSVAHPFVMGSGAAEPQVSCNAVTWSLFGLSLAAYNMIFSFVIAATGAFLLSRKHAA